MRLIRLKATVGLKRIHYIRGQCQLVKPIAFSLCIVALGDKTFQTISLTTCNFQLHVRLP